ncbi:MAG: hypothetical protein GY778_21305 [bacterium]|nr:hypothetical protein [bacterium]
MKLPPLIGIDLVGALAVAACAGVGVWQGLVEPNGSAQRIRDLSAETAEFEANLNKTGVILESKQTAYRERQAALGERDLLPDTIPLERDLRTLTELADRNRLEIDEFTPLPSRQYPGVQEDRYRLRATGRFADFISFLGEFEQHASWTDITFVNLTSPEAESSVGKSGVMVVSLYSAITAPPATEDDQQP